MRLVGPYLEVGTVPVVIALGSVVLSVLHRGSV
jgi:hypothetical protein